MDFDPYVCRECGGLGGESNCPRCGSSVGCERCGVFPVVPADVAAEARRRYYSGTRGKELDSMLHLKVPQKGKNDGPRIVFRPEHGLALSEDVTDKTICHVMLNGVNYTVDSPLDDVAKALGIPVETAEAAGGAKAA